MEVMEKKKRDEFINKIPEEMRKKSISVIMLTIMTSMLKMYRSMMCYLVQQVSGDGQLNMVTKYINHKRNFKFETFFYDLNTKNKHICSSTMIGWQCTTADCQEIILGENRFDD